MHDHMVHISVKNLVPDLVPDMVYVVYYGETLMQYESSDNLFQRINMVMLKLL